MTEDQRKIVESFPAADRGEFDPNAAEGIVESDPVAANERKIEVRKQAMIEKRSRRIRLEDGEDDDEENYDGSDMDEEEEEEDEDLAYDSEEEAKEDLKYIMKHA
eukprot:CAMPEP_0176398466 /NCGR_PEP_ID=MMETSP0126-20121128/45948_1 /TAXON_ID=141414 ORGANISM="Strombidinopsis acuminatum, Strain SPMC142" /NCGR_SAMPLE_ID=MMETSP0126 /ASSEMBLY_ACC=CAM_ASM_000229 /LENGTH=104 /DNA_ID=CAMNT_0017773395 /DNA_START=157 /DNA_END=471 /DNA_ORIENTATION=+